MNRILLSLLSTFLVISVSGQPQSLQTRMDTHKNTLRNERLPGFSDITDKFERSRQLRPPLPDRPRIKSQHQLTHQLDSVIVEEFDGITEDTKFEFEYNSDDQLIHETSYSKDIDSDIWSPDWRNSLFYDDDGNVIEDIISLWEQSLEDWLFYDLEESTFDAEGKLVQTILYLWDGVEKDWYPAWLETYTYDNGNLIEELFQYYTEENELVNDWIRESKYDDDNNLIEETESVWDAGEWLPDFRAVYVYESGVLNEGLFYEWDEDVPDFIEEWKFEYTYDDDGNASELIYSLYDIDISEWIPYWANEYSYDENSNLVEDTSYSIENGVREPVERYEYLLNNLTLSEEILTPYGFSYILLFRNMLTEINVHLYDGEDWVTDSRTVFYYNEYGNNLLTLTINIEGEGSVHVDGEPYTGALYFEPGSEITLEAIPVENYEFLSWSGDLDSANELVTLMIDGNKIITATFGLVNSAEIISGDDEIPEAFPNPFRNSITVNNPGNVDGVKFINLIGRTVKEVNMTGSGTRTISTADLDNGIYLVVFSKRNGESVILKMMKD